MNSQNYLDHNTLAAEDTSKSYGSETTGYGLDVVENLESTELQLNPVQSFSLERGIQALPYEGRVSPLPLPVLEANSPDNELVFIDSTVEDIETLTDNISGATEVIVLDSDRDELVQISEHLSNYEDLEAVHIVSHGESGQLSFGNAILNSDTLSRIYYIK